MGNHEFCSRCHASDFHYGQTCEQAYPEKLARAEKERAERKQQSLDGGAACRALLAKLRKMKIPAEIEEHRFEDGELVTTVVIKGHNLIGNRRKAMTWTNPEYWRRKLKNEPDLY